MSIETLYDADTKEAIIICGEDFCTDEEYNEGIAFLKQCGPWTTIVFDFRLNRNFFGKARRLVGDAALLSDRINGKVIIRNAIIGRCCMAFHNLTYLMNGRCFYERTQEGIDTLIEMGIIKESYKGKSTPYLNKIPKVTLEEMINWNPEL